MLWLSCFQSVLVVKRLCYLDPNSVSHASNRRSWSWPTDLDTFRSASAKSFYRITLHHAITHSVTPQVHPGQPYTLEWATHLGDDQALLLEQVAELVACLLVLATQLHEQSWRVHALHWHSLGCVQQTTFHRAVSSQNKNTRLCIDCVVDQSTPVSQTLVMSSPLYPCTLESKIRQSASYRVMK